MQTDAAPQWDYQAEFARTRAALTGYRSKTHSAPITDMQPGDEPWFSINPELRAWQRMRRRQQREVHELSRRYDPWKDPIYTNWQARLALRELQREPERMPQPMKPPRLTPA
jgi:hypothetical protein